MVQPRRDPNTWPARALALSALLLVATQARPAEELSVEAVRRGDALEITCRAELEAPVAIVWETLTDYDHLAEFIPGMLRSRVLERRGSSVVVEQSGEARFLFFSIPIEVTLATSEQPPLSIEASMLKGNLKRLQGTYRIEPRGGARVLLSWTGTIEALSLPPLIGEMLMRGSVEDQFRGMVREIERREALRREKEPAK
jgi:ribosome-associated toxin RatA of RatAB toxin-antitoxin module